jgi:predicted nucleic acid-binding protein
MARSVVDTNILIYSRDVNEPAKRVRAIEVIDQLGASGDLVLTSQILNEFSAALLRRGAPIADVRAAVESWRDLAEVLPLQPATTTVALDAVDRHRLSFWDALIWATARDAQVKIVISEDFQHGRAIDGVTFVDPFRDPPRPRSTPSDS